MKQEFNLSKKIRGMEGYKAVKDSIIVEDVKEFIRRLKEMIKNESGSEYGRIWDKLDKLAGEKLI